MSQRELIDAYVDGRISRRVFIRRLVATGVAMSAAATYATALGDEAFAAHSRTDCKSQFESDGDKKKFLKCMDKWAKAREKCAKFLEEDGDKTKYLECIAKTE